MVRRSAECEMDERKRSQTILTHRKHRYSRAGRFLKGNDYRLVAAIDFEKGIVWIKRIGTHRDYDRIDVGEVDHVQ